MLGHIPGIIPKGRDKNWGGRISFASGFQSRLTGFGTKMRQSVTNRACDKNNGPPGSQAARRHICTSAAQRGKDMSPATAVCSKSCLLTLKLFVGEHIGEAIVFMIQ